MRKLALFGAIAAFTPAVALAHDTGVPHLHPHGIGVVMMGLIIAFVGFYLYKSQESGRQEVRQESHRPKK